MADEQPPNSEPKDPRKPSESGGFNWRVLILFGIALGLLTIALSGAGNSKGKPISFSQFKKSLKEGKITTSSTHHLYQQILALLVDVAHPMHRICQTGLDSLLYVVQFVHA